MLDSVNPTCDLEVDGGVHDHNIAMIVRHGANVLVTGSSVYNDQASVAENIAGLRQALSEG